VAKIRGTAAAVEAERRRYAEEALVREAELRERLPVRIEALEAVAGSRIPNNTCLMH
jgi:hypothetical protein